MSEWTQASPIAAEYVALKGLPVQYRSNTYGEGQWSDYVMTDFLQPPTAGEEFEWRIKGQTPFGSAPPPVPVLEVGKVYVFKGSDTRYVFTRRAGDFLVFELEALKGVPWIWLREWKAFLLEAATPRQTPSLDFVKGKVYKVQMRDGAWVEATLESKGSSTGKFRILTFKRVDNHPTPYIAMSLDEAPKRVKSL